MQTLPTFCDEPLPPPRTHLIPPSPRPLAPNPSPSLLLPTIALSLPLLSSTSAAAPAASASSYIRGNHLLPAHNSRPWNDACRGAQRYIGGRRDGVEHAGAEPTRVNGDDTWRTPAGGGGTRSGAALLRLPRIHASDDGSCLHTVSSPLPELHPPQLDATPPELRLFSSVVLDDAPPCESTMIGTSRPLPPRIWMRMAGVHGALWRCAYSRSPGPPMVYGVPVEFLEK